jgi:hypothetical protein
VPIVHQRGPRVVRREKADPKKADDSFQAAWPQTNPDAFYNAIAPILKAARQGDPVALAQINSLLTEVDESIDAKKHNRAFLLDKIRVSAQVSPGASRGSGLDEIFQTASTAEWIKRSAGGAPGRRPVSWRKDPPSEFDWVDAQRYLRVRTESLMWWDTKDELSGHSGAVWRSLSKTGWFTTDQASFHESRDDAERNSSTPLNAAIRGISLMLSKTIAAREYLDVAQRKHSGRGYDTANRDLSQDPDWQEAGKTLAEYRERLKLTLAELQNNWTDTPPVAPGFAPTWTAPPAFAPASPYDNHDYNPPSPISFPAPDPEFTSMSSIGQYIQAPVAHH